MIFVKVFNTQLLPGVSHSTPTLMLFTSGNQSERIKFFLTDSPLVPVVLGHPWLTPHNPTVDWNQSSISAWSKECYAPCLVSACSAASCVSLQDEMVNLSNVPREFHNMKEVFSKSRAASLPLHLPYDCAIDRVPGTSPP